jgi:ATP-dependent protease HslVU (ClpYQ) peptidase subunit
MTCVVALREKGVIYMGADSAGVGGWYNRQNRMDPKIYRVGAMLIGFTTSFRMGQLLGYSLVLPHHHADVPVEKYMTTAFINAVRDCLKAGGWAEKDKDQERGGNFLTAYQGRIFEVQSDYQVAESAEDFSAVGCGFDLALGSLYTSKSLGGSAARRRVELALEAAASFSAGVHGPFRIEELVDIPALAGRGQRPPKPPPPPAGRMIREGVVPPRGAR